MYVQSRPASQPVIGGAPERASLVLGSGRVAGDVDGVTGCALAVPDPAGLTVVEPGVADRPGAAPGAEALAPQAATAATDPAINAARAVLTILIS